MYTPQDARVLLDEAHQLLEQRLTLLSRDLTQLIQQTEDAHGRVRIALSQLEDLQEAQRAYPPGTGQPAALGASRGPDRRAPAAALLPTPSAGLNRAGGGAAQAAPVASSRHGFMSANRSRKFGGEA